MNCYNPCASIKDRSQRSYFIDPLQTFGLRHPAEVRLCSALRKMLLFVEVLLWHMVVDTEDHNETGAAQKLYDAVRARIFLSVRTTANCRGQWTVPQLCQKNKAKVPPARTRVRYHDASSIARTMKEGISLCFDQYKSDALFTYTVRRCLQHAFRDILWLAYSRTHAQQAALKPENNMS